MVVDGRAPNASALSDLTHGDRLEGLLGHQRPERLKQTRTSQLAVRGERLANNLRHTPILTLCPYVSSNGTVHGRQRAQRATTASTIGRSAPIHGSAARFARGTHLASRCDAPARGAGEPGATSASHTPITRPPRIGHHCPPSGHTRSPIVRRAPSSSAISRVRATVGCSPSSTLPPGSSNWPRSSYG